MRAKLSEGHFHSSSREVLKSLVCHCRVPQGWKINGVEDTLDGYTWASTHSVRDGCSQRNKKVLFSQAPQTLGCGYSLGTSDLLRTSFFTFVG